MSAVERKIPAQRIRTEITVVNSRFLTTVVPVKSVDEAKESLRAIRAEMPDASHHVYAYRIGHANSVIDGMSDDGEPSGTSGPPVLAVLRGSGLGDVLVVVTRYFGGTKLGTGGLVRAYSEAARTGLEATPIELKIARTLVGIEAPYPLFDQIKRLIDSYSGIIEEQDFAANVTLMVRFETRHVIDFNAALVELSAGQVSVIELEQTN
jgi:uncharacterized YigZ family protein